jgi:hypothetical protein
MKRHLTLTAPSSPAAFAGTWTMSRSFTPWPANVAQFLF